MKALFMVLTVMTSISPALADSQQLCPRYRCTAESAIDPHGRHFGDGYADKLAEAQQKAIADCEDDGGYGCFIDSCDKYTGPTFPIFSNCKSQW